MRSFAPDTATHSISASAIRLAPHHSSTRPQGTLVPLRSDLAPLYGDDFINRAMVFSPASTWRRANVRFLSLEMLRLVLRPPQARAAFSTVAAAPSPMATELLKYAFGSLKVRATHSRLRDDCAAWMDPADRDVRVTQSGVTDDVLRTVEHGSQMLQAPSDAGPVKLLLTRLHVERGRHDAAVDVLHSLMDPAQGYHPRCV